MCKVSSSCSASARDPVRSNSRTRLGLKFRSPNVALQLRSISGLHAPLLASLLPLDKYDISPDSASTFDISARLAREKISHDTNRRSNSLSINLSVFSSSYRVEPKRRRRRRRSRGEKERKLSAGRAELQRLLYHDRKERQTITVKPLEEDRGSSDLLSRCGQTQTILAITVLLEFL